MDTKPWYQSKTIWGGVIQALVVGLALFHVNIADQAEPLANGVYAVAGLIGTIMVIVGRVKAVTVISSTPNLPGPGSPLMRLLIAGALIGCSVTLPSCASSPTGPAATSDVAIVGNDLATNFAAAIKAFEDYQDGNVDLTQSIANVAVAYKQIVTTVDDVKQLVHDATGGAGDSQKLSAVLARIYAESSKPPAQKAADLATAAQKVAAAP